MDRLTNSTNPHSVSLVPPPPSSKVLQPNAGQDLLILGVSRSHKTTHYSRQDSSGRVISPTQRPLSDNTQHSQQANIHASGGIRIHNLRKRAASDPRFIPRGHWLAVSLAISPKCQLLTSHIEIINCTASANWLICYWWLITQMRPSIKYKCHYTGLLFTSSREQDYTLTSFW